MSITVSNNVKRCKVFIFGEQYHLVTDEQEAHVAMAAKLVDSYMHEISEKGNLTDAKKIAVLTALQLASKMLISENLLNKHLEHNDKLIELINREWDNTL